MLEQCDGSEKEVAHRDLIPDDVFSGHRVAQFHIYCVHMKNITLSVDEGVLAAVRRYTAERNSTVNALVRESLTNIAQHEDRARRARARLTQLSKLSQGRLGRKTWTRADLYER